MSGGLRLILLHKIAYSGTVHVVESSDSTEHLYDQMTCTDVESSFIVKHRPSCSAADTDGERVGATEVGS